MTDDSLDYFREGMFHRPHPEILLDRSSEGPCLFTVLGRSHQLEIPVRQVGHSVVCKSDPGFGDPSDRHLAASNRSRVSSVVLQHLVNLLLDVQRRRAPAVLDLAESRWQIIRGGITSHHDELV